MRKIVVTEIKKIGIKEKQKRQNCEKDAREKGR